MNTNFVNAAFHRGRARAERSNPTGAGQGYRNMRYSAARAEPGQRGYAGGKLVILDEAAFYADPRNMYTFQDKTVKKYTQAQAYQHAAMVIRSRNGLDPNTQIFSRGTYNSRDTEPTLTLVQFNDLVEKLIFNR